MECIFDMNDTAVPKKTCYIITVKQKDVEKSTLSFDVINLL